MLVVVVGASGGLGSYVATEMAKSHRVMGTYLANQIPLDGVKMVRMDATNLTDSTRLAETVRGNDIVLVNLAGSTCANITHKLSSQDWRDVLNVNLNAPFYLARSFIPIMRERGWGRIINAVSVVSQLGVPGTSAYAASKEGVVGLTRVLAKENARKGITVNAISLGYFDRGMIDAVPEKMLETIKVQIPVGHLGHPQNIVSAIKFLIEADYVTGAVIPINGGLV